MEDQLLAAMQARLVPLGYYLVVRRNDTGWAARAFAKSSHLEDKVAAGATAEDALRSIAAAFDIRVEDLEMEHPQGAEKRR